MFSRNAAVITILSAVEVLEIFTPDIIAACLYGVLKEVICMRLSSEIAGGKNSEMFAQLRKDLSGLK